MPIVLIPRGERISSAQRAQIDKAFADVKAWYTKQLYPKDLRWGDIKVLRGKKSAAHYLKNDNIWREIPGEIRSAFGWDPWAGGRAAVVMGAGLLGWAGANGGGDNGVAIIGLESLIDTSKCAKEWWCNPTIWRGTVIHETGHVLTLPHSKDPSIMAFHGDYQNKVLLANEKRTVRGLPFARPVPMCGRDLYCRRNARSGADSCRQSQTAKSAIFCCPKGHRLMVHPDASIGEYCAKPPVCGRGLYCSGSPVDGGSACRQDPKKDVAIFCCPKGMKLSGNRCVDGNALRVAAVTQIYRDVLNREPDPGGLKSWSNSSLTLKEIRKRIAHSKESQNKLHGLYKKYLCRRGEPAGMAYWQKQLASHQTFKQVDRGFYNSKEAKKLRAAGRYKNGVCVAGPSPRVAAVAQIYRDVLNREPDPGGLKSWSGSSLDLKEIRRRIAHSKESQSKLHGLYKRYLCRRGEPAGMAHWQKQLGAHRTFKQVDRDFYNSKEAQGLRAAGKYRNGICYRR